MNISVIINQMIILFLLIGMGYLLYKVGMIDSEFNRKLTRIMLNVTMPAMILSSVLSQNGDKDFRTVGLLFVIAIILYLALPVIGWLIVTLFPIPDERKSMFWFMTIYSNVGFMGFPVINALFGATAVFYASIFNMIFNLSVYTFGIWMMGYKRRQTIAMRPSMILNPGIILTVLALIIYCLPVHFPDAINTTVDYLGSITVPLSMLVIGATLASMNVRELFNDFGIYPYTIFRQIVFPLACFPLLKLFIHDELVLGVTFILLMMPVANTAVLYATEYKNDEKLAAKAVFLTTLVCLFSIPLLIAICF